MHNRSLLTRIGAKAWGCCHPRLRRAPARRVTRSTSLRCLGKGLSGQKEVRNA